VLFTKVLVLKTKSTPLPVTAIAPPLVAEFPLKRDPEILTFTEFPATIAPPLSDDVLFSKTQSVMVKLPLEEYIAPPPASLVTEFPVKVQFSKVAVAPALLLKKTPPPTSVVLLFKNVRFLKVTSAEVAPLIVNNLPVPQFPSRVELASKPSIVNAKLLEVRFIPSSEIVPIMISSSPSEFTLAMAVPKFPNAFDSLDPSMLPAPVADTYII
jgi:hypothetical protein